nr:uncharacterized protein LOC109185573 [Ipomoea batatas]
MNGSTWYSDRSSQRLGGGIHEVEQISALSAKVDNVATMVQKLAQITLQNRNVSYVSTPSSPSRQVLICDLCGGGHNLGECLNEDTNSQSSVEHIDLVGYNRPQQSFQPQGAYNPNTSRNHPGFSWSNPMGAANPQHFGNRGSSPGFQGQSNYRGAPPQQFRPTQGFQLQAPIIQPRPPLPTLKAPPPPNWEAMMEMMVKSQLQSDERFRQVTERLDQLCVHNKMLENQLANQASTSSTKATGKLPACPENPREHVNAIVTRSGKKLEEPPLPVDKPRPSKIIDVEIEEKLEEEEANPPVLNSSPQSHEKDEKEKPERKYVPPLPFPQKFQRQAKDNPNSRVIERCYRADVMGSKTRDGDANFTHVKKVDKGCLLGFKACDRNFNEASDGGSLLDGSQLETFSHISSSIRFSAFFFIFNSQNTLTFTPNSSLGFKIRWQLAIKTKILGLIKGDRVDILIKPCVDVVGCYVELEMSIDGDFPANIVGYPTSHGATCLFEDRCNGSPKPSKTAHLLSILSSSWITPLDNRTYVDLYAFSRTVQWLPKS